MKIKGCSLLEKVLAYVLVFAMLITCVPFTKVNAEEPETDEPFATVKIEGENLLDITDVSLKSTGNVITKADGKYSVEATFTYNGAGDLVYADNSEVAEDSETGKLVISQAVTVEEMLEAKLNGKNAEYSVTVHDNNDTTQSATVKFTVYPDKVSFCDGSKVVYPIANGVKVTEDGNYAVTNNGSAFVEAVNNQEIKIQANTNDESDYTLEIPVDQFDENSAKCKVYISTNGKEDWKLVETSMDTDNWFQISSVTPTTLYVNFTLDDVKNATSEVYFLLKCYFGTNVTSADEYILVKLDLSKLTLTKKIDGTDAQTYPAFGKVSVKAGTTEVGTATGNETNYVVFTVNGKTEIPYSTDGWKLCVTSDDTSVDDEYINITPANLKEAEFSFSAELDYGEKGKQMVVVKGTSSDITLKKEDQTGFEFKVKNPENVIYVPATAEVAATGNTYTNIASGGEGKGTVKYTVTDTTPHATVDSDGNVTLNETGEASVKAGETVNVHVKAVKTEDENSQYNNAEAEYVVSFTKESLDYGFDTAEVNIDYSKDGTYIQTVKDKDGKEITEDIEYSISDSNVATIDTSTGEVTFVKAGTVTVTAKYTGEKYIATQRSYTLVIKPATLDDTELSYGEKQITLAYGETGVKIDSEKINNKYNLPFVKYESENTATVSVDTEGNITANAVGETRIAIYFDGEGRYDVSSPVYVDVKVEKADRGLAFVKETAEVTFNDNNNIYAIPALKDFVGNGSITPVYSVSGKAEIENGNIKITGAGEITLTAKIAGDTNYKDAEASFKLTVKKASQTIAFTQNGTDGVIQKYYGLKSFANTASEQGTNYGTGKITYTTDSEAIATVDENGELTFKDSQTGTVKVTATKEADENYEKAEAVYTLNITRLAAPETNPCEVSGTKGKDGWFVSDVQISAKGYKLSYSGKLSDDFVNALDYSVEGTNEVTVYLKNAEGAITEAVNVEVKADKTNPDNLKAEVLEPGFFDRILSFFGKETLKVKLSAGDVISGIEKFVCTATDGTTENTEEIILSADDVKYDEENKEYYGEVKFDIKDGKRDGYRVSFKAYDNAGNETQYENTYRIYEDKAAELTIIPENGMVMLDKDGKKTENEKDAVSYLSNEPFNVSVKVKEENFDADDAKIYINDVLQENTVWTDAASDDASSTDGSESSSTDGNSATGTDGRQSAGTVTKTADITFDTEGEYKLKIYYKDKLANESSKDISVIYYDNNNIKISFDEINALNKEDVTVKVSVDDKYFDSSKVSLSSTTAKDINGNPVEFTTFPEINWSASSTSVHTGTFTLDKEGIYTLVAEYTDAQTATHRAEKQFTIDKTEPENVTFKYNNETSLANVLFFNGTVDAAITVSDKYSGVEKIELGLIKDDVFEAATSLTLPDGLVLYADASEYTGNAGDITVPDSYAEKNNGTVTFKVKIPASFRGRLSVIKVYDAAGNVLNTQTANEKIVIDDIAPDIKFIYSGSPANKANGKYYFNTEEENAKLNVEITEANFDKTQVAVTDKNGTAVTGLTWTDLNNNELHKFAEPVEFTAEGEYAVTVAYTDASGNAALNEGTAATDGSGKFTSKTLVVDNTKPVIEATFTPAYSQNMYCTGEVVAEIKITETNFNASQEDIIAVTATDAAGKSVDLVQGTDWTIENWKSENGANTAKLVFKKDGCYTLTVNSTDFAGNKADEKQYSFVVDNTKPVCEKAVTSDGNLFNNIINYFKDEAEITFVAKDTTSGISFITVNAFDTVDYATDITFPENLVINADGTFGNYSGQKLSIKSSSYENGELTVTLVVPAQFNGNLGFTATDNSGNVSAKTAEDDKVSLKYEYGVVVDNVSPTCEVQWSSVKEQSFINAVNADNETVASDADAVRYINDGSVQADITITEANFYSNDVKISVTKDNVAYTAYTSSGWTSESGVNKCKLTFAEDGNYVVKIDYTDKSTNEMTTYTSKIYTVDTTAPVMSFTVDGNDASVAAFNGTYFGKNVTGTISVTDRNFREDEFGLVVNAENGTYSAAKLVWENDAQNTDKWTADINFNVDATYSVKLDYADMAGNKATEINSGFTVDTNAPERKVTFETPAGIVDKDNNDVDSLAKVTENDGSVLYYGKSTSVKVEITEVNFKPENVNVCVNGTKKTDLSWASDGYLRTAYINLSDDGDYVITVNYTDPAGKIMSGYTSQKIVVDKTAPVIDVKYSVADAENTFGARDYFKANQDVTVTVTEHNFRASDTVLTVKAKNTENADVTVTDYSAYAKDSKNWTADGDKHILKLKFDTDANYTLDIAYNDLAVNKAESYSKEFTVDKAAPVPVEPAVKYSDTETVFERLVSALTFRYYKADADITFTVNDIIADIDYFTVTAKNYASNGSTGATNVELPSNLVIKADGTIGTGTAGFISKADVAKGENANVSLTFNVPADFRGTFELKATDRSGNTYTVETCDAMYENGIILVTDKTAPEIEVTFDGANLKNTVEVDGAEITRATKTAPDASTRYIYSGKTSATIVIKEANFFDDIVKVSYVKNNGESVKVAPEWTKVSDKADTYKCTVDFADEGDYVLTVECADKAGNSANIKGEYSGKKTEKTFNSNLFTIDTTAPVVTITDKATSSAFVENKFYADASETAVITVEDHTFRPGEFVITATATDFNGKDIAAALNFTPDLTDWTSWTKNAENPDIYTAEVTFPAGANYTFKVDYKDLADYTDTDNTAFTVDNTKPTELSISYENTDKQKEVNGFNEKYYAAATVVTLKAKDIASGIECFKISTANVNTEATKITLPENLTVYADGTVTGSKGSIENIAVVRTKSSAEANTEEYVVTFTVPAGYTGQFVFTAVDKSQNSESFSDKTVVVTDSVAPVVKISYAGNLTDTVDADNKHLDAAGEGSRAIYSGAVTATVEITEANFYKEDVKISATLDGKAYDKFALGEWVKSAENKYTATVNFADDGDYVLSFELTDRSANEAKISGSEYAAKTSVKAYKSNVFTVDTVIPVVSVTYDNNSALNGSCYKADRTATIKVDDRNFRPDEVVFNVVAKDICNADVTEYTYSKLTSWEDWTQNGTVWTATVPFNKDANYAVTFGYNDIAKNTAAEFTDSFTVDKVQPVLSDAEYSAPNKFEEILGKLFKFYKGDAEITFTVKDVTSGIDYITVNAIKNEELSKNATDIVLPSDLKISPVTGYVSGELGSAKIEEFGQGKDAQSDTFTFVISVPADFNGEFVYTATDRSGNTYEAEEVEGEKKDAGDDNVIVVTDKVSPEISIAYEGTLRDKVDYDTANITRQTREADASTRYVYSGNVKATVKVSEANFYAEDVTITATLDGAAYELGEVKWTRTEGTDEYVTEFEFEKDGDYVLSLEYTDRSANEANIASAEYTAKTSVKTYSSNIFTIDTIKPVINVTYDNNSALNDNYYKADRKATVEITDRNFRPNEMALTIESKDSNGNDVEFKCTDLNAWASWKQDKENPDKWIATVDFNVDATYKVAINYKDIAENKLDEYKADFTVDKLSPVDLKTEYSKTIFETLIEKLTFKYYKSSATVTISASDATSYIDYFTVNAKTEGSTGSTDIKLPVDLVINADGTVRSGDTGSLTEIKAVENKKGYAVVSFDIPANFRGEVIFTATDFAGNVYGAASDGGDDSVIVVTDNVSPEISIAYEGTLRDKIDYDTADITRQTREADTNTRFVYSDSVRATVTVIEPNFYSQDIVITATRDGVEYKGFKLGEWTSENDIHTVTVDFAEDGDYVLSLEYADRSANEANIASAEYAEKTSVKTYSSNIFTIDTVKPVVEVSYDNNKVVNDKYYDAARTATIKVTDRNFRPNEVKFNVIAKDVLGNEVSFDYSDLTSWSDWTQNGITWTAKVKYYADANYTVTFDYTDIAENKADSYNAIFTVDTVAPTELTIDYSTPLLSKLIGYITFNYYKPDVTVTLTAKDVTAGVEYFTLNASSEGSENATDIELPENLVIKADGTVVSGKTGSLKNIKCSKNETDVIAVTFTAPATFRGNFTFAATDLSHNSADTSDKVISVVDKTAPVRSVSITPARAVNTNMADVEEIKENDGTVLYFNGNATVTFTVTEANFYAEDVVITVNDKSVTPTEWVKNGDTYTSTYTLSADGDYIVKMTYTDRSGNVMQNYTSQRIVIDTVKPVISVDYADKTPEGELNGRKYFDGNQTATVTIKEHNFRAQDVVVNVTAKDVTGKNVKSFTFDEDGNVKLYADNAKTASNWSANEAQWRREDDTYVLTLVFSENANYTFDIEYTDLATNESVDYKTDEFTVDKIAPENLKIEYSTNVFSQILESLTFGFYKAKMQVTISATDDIAGVQRFMYSYKNALNISSVNKELIDAVINSNKITYEGNKATATFTIPNLNLTEREQFRGSVQFTAFDRSENSNLKQDKSVLVVDNISPVAQISYSTPINTSDGVSYYNGSVDATIVINEANFFSSDVKVTVTKDSANYPVNVKWTDNSYDVHTGTFTLTAEGDYYVSVEYADKSGNELTPYKSNRITVDTTAPSISVSDIIANTANNDEVIGFTITCTDTNFDISSFTPVLKAVIRNENGSFETKNISLGSPATVESGKTYSYTVKNLSEDAYYTLSCSVKDMATNSTTDMRTEDSATSSNIAFSVNRNGSVFSASEYTLKVSQNYYVYEIGDDIVIEETNVDAIENYTVKLNGKVLQEGKDYTSELPTSSSANGKWTVRTYKISKSLFGEEGEYSIVIESVDKTETAAYSDVKNLNVSFVVDKTAPVVVISGLEEGGRYQVEEQTVVLVPTDDGGCLNSIKVVIFDSDGNPIKDENGNDISVKVDLSGEDLTKALKENDGKITFTVPEGLENQVQIICNDCAEKSDGTTNEYNETFKKVTVSMSGWIIFYANKPLFYSTIGGAVLAIGGVIFLIVFRKRKKSGNG